MKYLALVLKNLLRSPRRTVLTCIAMGASTFLLTALVAMARTTDTAPGVGELTLSVGPQQGTLTSGMVERIRQMDGVRAVMGFMYAGAQGRQENERITLAAVDPDSLRLIWPDTMDIPRNEYEPFMRERTGLLAGREPAKAMGWKIGDTVTLKVSAGNGAKADMTFRVLGYNVEGPWGNICYIHRAYLNEAIGRPDYVNSIFLSAARREDVSKLMQAIDAAFANSPNPTRTQTHQQSLSDTVATMENVRLLLGGIAIIVGAAVLLIATNSMALALRARLKEIAILKTLGFTTGRVLSIVLSEAAMIGLAGGLLGAAVALGLLRELSMPMNPRASFSVDPSSAAVVVGVAILLGVAGALAPAVSACRRRAIEVLRSLG